MQGEPYTARRKSDVRPPKPDWLEALPWVVAIPASLGALVFGGIQTAASTALLAWVLGLMVAMVIEDVGPWDRPRTLDPIELEAQLATLVVRGQRLPLATLRWRRHGWAGLRLVHDHGELVLDHLEDRARLEAFLDRHIERAQERHGEGMQEVPAPLQRARAPEQRT